MPSFKRVRDDATVEISGATWNQVINRLERVESRLITTNPQDQMLRELMVRNDTGANIDPFRIVAIGDPVVMRDAVADNVGYRFQNVFVGEETDEDTDCFGITKKGIPSDLGGGVPGVGQIQTTGATTALIDVQDVDHLYAKPSATNGVLESTESETNLRILYSGQTGEVECKVLFVSKPIQTVKYGRLPAGDEINFGDTFTMRVFRNGADTGETIEDVHWDKFPHDEPGTDQHDMKIRWVADENLWRLDNLECPPEAP